MASIIHHRPSPIPIHLLVLPDFYHHVFSVVICDVKEEIACRILMTELDRCLRKMSILRESLDLFAQNRDNFHFGISYPVDIKCITIRFCFFSHIYVFETNTIVDGLKNKHCLAKSFLHLNLDVPLNDASDNAGLQSFLFLGQQLDGIAIYGGLGEVLAFGIVFQIDFTTWLHGFVVNAD